MALTIRAINKHLSDNIIAFFVLREIDVESQLAVSGHCLVTSTILIEVQSAYI